MSKKQFEDVGAERGPESGIIAPEKIIIIENADTKHPKHRFYSTRLAHDNPDILSMVESMVEVGWPKGSMAWLTRDGDHMRAATARRRITAATIANPLRKAAKKPAIVVPYMVTTDPDTAEAIENAGRVGLPPMQLAREFIALREEHGDEKKAAALLVIPLATARMLEKCLSLPREIRQKVNALEIPIDVAARMAGAGSSAAQAAVGTATDPATGKVDGAKVKRAAREAKPPRPRGLNRDEIAYLALVVKERATWTGEQVAELLAYTTTGAQRGEDAPPMSTAVAKATTAAETAAKEARKAAKGGAP